MPSFFAVSFAFFKSREAIAAISLHSPFCIPGITFLVAIDAAPSTPHFTFPKLATFPSASVPLLSRRAAPSNSSYTPLCYYRACGLRRARACRTVLLSPTLKEDSSYAQRNHHPVVRDARSGRATGRQPAVGASGEERRYARSNSQGRRHGAGFYADGHAPQSGVLARLSRQEK